MKKTLSLLLITGAILCARASAQSYISNGTFDQWQDLHGSPPSGQPIGWGGSSIAQIPGLTGQSDFSALLKGRTMLYQELNPTLPFPSNFCVSQIIAVTNGDGWQQPLWITLQETGPKGGFEKRHDWIQLRIEGSDGAFSIQANNGSAGNDRWQTIAKDVFTPSEYDPNKNVFPTKNAYVITISRAAGSSSYSVSYGKVGEKLATVADIKHFAEPSNGSGQLAFIAYSGVGDASQYWAAVSSVDISTLVP